MKNIFKLSLLSAFALLLLNSCEENDPIYKGPLQVEFAPLSTSSTYTSAFGKTVKQNLFLSTVDTVELKIQLVGPQQSRDMTVEYNIVADTVKNFPVGATTYLAPTNAVEGTHYVFIPARSGAANGVVTIPANSSFGYIKLNSIAGQVAPDVNKRVLIQLLPTDDLIVNPNYQYLTVTITRL
jgi:hypothetical protein